MYVQVSIPISSFKTFTYSVNNLNKNQIFPGQSVVVSFRNQTTIGFILSVLTKPNFQGRILSIKSINKDSFNISNELWKTINWISQYYICSIGKTLHATIPYQHIDKLDSQLVQKVRITDLGKHAIENQIIKYSNQVKVLKYLLSESECIYHDLGNICISYQSTVKRLKQLKFIDVYRKTVAHQNIQPKEYQLTQQQKDIVEKILNDWKVNKKPALLSGVSGSGKTLIYIDLIKSFIKTNKDVIVLVPEIALIKELHDILDKYFPNIVIAWHSKIKKTDKKEALLKIKSTNPTIVVATRSGLFMPLSNLGLIVIDEEQESSYKEEGKAPYYHARDVALMRASFSNSKIILVSSSPSLESFFKTEKKQFLTYSLKDRFKNYKLPKILIINMKNKENYGKGFGMISRKLFEEISFTLKKNKQVLLLHNRIGDQIKKLENILTDLFSDYTIRRYDRETIKMYGYFKLLKNFHEQKINILLGTQMIAKGIDFKNVSLVGILNADLGISTPDFRSEEKLFQLAYQFIGRAGRHSNTSKAIIQTFSPDDIYIKSIYQYNIDKFYNYVLKDRKSLFYPPYSRLIRIIISSKNNKIAQNKSEYIRDIFVKNRNLQIIGPSETIMHQINNLYRYHLLIKMKKNYWITLFHWIDKELGFDMFERKNNNLKIKLDVDPVSFF